MNQAILRNRPYLNFQDCSPCPRPDRGFSDTSGLIYYLLDITERI